MAFQVIFCLIDFHHSKSLFFQVFGAGQRSCIGERLAITESKFMLAEILRKFRFVVGEKTIVPPKLVTNTFTTRSPHDLLLKVEPR